MQIYTIDLLHLGFAQRIAAYLVVGPQGTVLIETGPASCHPALVEGLARNGLEPSDIHAVFVTHIHLDHAGAAGWWARQGVTVHVHPVGAPHLVDPEKLVNSATRLYGERMDELWGEILPAPEESVRILEDGDVVTVAGLEIEALDTPGHASHHHVYRVGGAAFLGDLGAIVLPGTDLVELPTVPPEYSLERWGASINRVLDLGLEAIYPTHFGRIDDVEGHLTIVANLLTEATDLVRSSLERGSTRQQIEEVFASWNRQRLVASGAVDDQIRRIEEFNPPTVSVAGILRDGKKKAGLLPRPEF